MADEAGIRPTLLIGVGGTGSEIAQNVYLRAKEQNASHSRLRVLAFDTDKIDQSRLSGLIEGRQAIGFSTASTIDDLLDRNPDIEREWFVAPRQTIPMELRKSNLLKGAGQVRMLTRLALFDAEASGNIENVLGSAVSDLIRYDNRTNPLNHIDVLIVGSLAGATGSGSFLQIAALVREIATKRNAETTARGLFLMPDVYVRTGTLSQKQIPSVLANGYASLKEFHAVTLKATQRGGKFDFEFEFAPGRYLRAGEIPFASITLIDYEDTGGGNLGRNLNAYRVMAEHAAYTLLFTPVGGKADSVTVNEIREVTEAAGRGTHNRIAAIGISAITYPESDIANYLRNQVAREIMAGDWLRLDRQYLARVRSFREQRAKGDRSAVEPEQGASYLEDIRQLALSEQMPFFREILDSLNPTTRDQAGNEIVQPQEEAYLDALNRQVIASFWSSEELRKIARRGQADHGQLASQSSLEDDVRRRENWLEDDYRQVDKALVNRPADILTNLFTMADDMSENDWRSHHLQNYLIRSGPHPVQTRAFLFALSRLIKEKRTTLRAEERREQYFRLANVFRAEGEDTKNPQSRGTPNVLKTAREASQRNIVNRLFKGGQREFVDSYVTYFNASIRKLVEYADARVLEKVCDRLLLEIEELIRVMNGLFREVGTLLQELEKGISEDEIAHDAAVLSGDMMYVCANSQCKRALWEEALDAMAGQRMEEGVNKSIMAAVYGMARRNRTSRKPEGLNALRDKFRASVIDGFAQERVRDDFASIYSKSIVEAIRYEAGVSEKDVARFLQSKLDLVRRQSQTMVTLTDTEAGDKIQFWALNDGIRGQLASIGDLNQLLMPTGQGRQALEEPEFPPTEILSVSLRVNLELAHLAKLSPPYQKDGSVAPDRAGRYFEEYQRMVDKLVDAAAENRIPDTITPHIHRDWHKPGLLPEISEEMTRKFVAETNQAFSVALAIGALFLEVSYNKRVAVVRTFGRVQTGGVDVVVANTHDMFEVTRGFVVHPEAVRGCLKLWKHELEKLGASAEADAWLANLARPDVVETILLMADTRRETSLRDERISDLVTGHCHMLSDALEVAKPNLPTATVLDEVGKLIASIRDAALESLRVSVADETIRIMESRHALGVERWRENVRT